MEPKCCGPASSTPSKTPSCSRTSRTATSGLSRPTRTTPTSNLTLLRAQLRHRTHNLLRSAISLQATFVIPTLPAACPPWRAGRLRAGSCRLEAEESRLDRSLTHIIETATSPCTTRTILHRLDLAPIYTFLVLPITQREVIRCHTSNGPRVLDARAPAVRLNCKSLSREIYLGFLLAASAASFSSLFT